MSSVKIIAGDGSAAGCRFALIVAKYHDFVTDRLQTGRADGAGRGRRPSEDIAIVRVPGRSRCRMAAQHAAESGCYDAVICLGCLIQGETPHWDYIASAVAGGLTAAAGATGVPITFGVLTTNSVEEALARAGEGPSNKGHEAAAAAIEMASVVAQLTRPPAKS